MAEELAAPAAPAVVAEPVVLDITPEPPPGSTAEPPRDWAALREKYAKGDEKIIRRLSRYSSEEAALDALISAQNKITGGGLKAPLPENPSAEEVAVWRKDNGIPIDAKGYDIPAGAVPEHAKAGVEAFLELAHTNNLTPAQVKAAVAWGTERAEQQTAVREAEDRQLADTARLTLRDEWGSEFTLNSNLISGLLDTAPAGVKDGLLRGRLADGTPIGSDPNTLRWLASMAREVNPTATVTAGAGTTSQQVIESELASISKLMGDRTSEYWRGPGADKMQARYRDLLDVQEKLKR